MKIFFPSIALFTSVFCHAQSYVPEKSNSNVMVKPVATVKAYAFNLKDIKLLNSPFKHAMEMDSAYLLSLKPDVLDFLLQM